MGIRGPETIRWPSDGHCQWTSDGLLSNGHWRDIANGHLMAFLSNGHWRDIANGHLMAFWSNGYWMDIANRHLMDFFINGQWMDIANGQLMAPLSTLGWSPLKMTQIKKTSILLNFNAFNVL